MVVTDAHIASQLIVIRLHGEIAGARRGRVQQQAAAVALQLTAAAKDQIGVAAGGFDQRTLFTAEANIVKTALATHGIGRLDIQHRGGAGGV